MENKTTRRPGPQPLESSTAQARGKNVIYESNLEMEGIRVAPKKIVRGIPCFGDSERVSGTMNRKDILALSRLAATMGWRKVALGIGDAFVRRYITDQNRSLFLSMLPIKEGERVLDVGAGWGNLAAQIAKGFPSSSVYATDKALEQLFFAEQIKKQEGLKNMRVIQCDITDPPFEKGFFDVVIMIGVLEWLGASVKTMSPRAAQERGLKAIYDIMRPGGRLLIGIENRIGYQNILGRQDRAKTAYTQRGYTRLLKDAGFEAVTFYPVLPNYWFPNRISDTHKVKEITHRRLTNALPGGVVRALTPSFYIVAGR